MRFFIGILFVCMLTFSAQAQALDQSNYLAVTHDQKIKQVLNLLKTHNQDTKKTLNTILGDNLTQKPIQIMFFDLSQLNISYENFDALTCKDKSGNLYILINKIHKNAPVEALASLLSHEVIHQDDQSSYEEEIKAWAIEAKTWHSFQETNPKLRNPELNKYALVKRMNTIEKMYVSANDSTILIAQEVHANSGYKGLPEYSSGFGI